MTIPHTKYGHSPSTHFRYLTCLLDRGHIIYAKPALFYIDAVQSVTTLYKSKVFIKSKANSRICHQPLIYYNNLKYYV